MAPRCYSVLDFHFTRFLNFHSHEHMTTVVSTFFQGPLQSLHKAAKRDESTDEVPQSLDLPFTPFAVPVA